MERRILLAAVSGILGFVSTAAAAAPAIPRATTVQLPTFNFFTVATTVEVPDSGAGYLGSVGSGASGRVDRGVPGLGLHPFANAAGGVARSGGGTSVRAEIHDLDAMDKALLAGGAAPTAGSAGLPRALATDAAGAQSVAELRRQQAVSDRAPDAEAERLFQQAGDFKSAGKNELAKVYYRMAACRGTGSLRDQAIAALAELSKPDHKTSEAPSASR